ncbi:MAG: DUF4373 domain-containing protein [Prevotella sp.]|nr:DUF4373 domain-containing protein [Prevotella sp.]
MSKLPTLAGSPNIGGPADFAALIRDGFIKDPRKLRSHPDVATLINDMGALGFGIYMFLNHELYNSMGGWCSCSARQIKVWASILKTTREKVRQVIDDYGLFVVADDRMTSTWMQVLFEKFAKKKSNSEENGADSCAYKYVRTEEKKRIREEKEKNKENQGCVCPEATHPDDGTDSPLAPSLDMIGPSAYEYIDQDGLRHGKKGELVPWWASPQTDVYKQWSLINDDWVSTSTIEPGQEELKRQQMTDADFRMATAYTKLDASEHYKIQDKAKHIIH